jgi:Zn-dependent peptidase ImmA (M78 family)
MHHAIKPHVLKSAADFKEIERQAFHFAGAFLMPAESFGAEIWSPSLNTFVALKERWKVSVGAMLMRCIALGIITENYQRQIWKYYSARGWRKKEPLDDVLVPESPRLLARSIKLLIEENVRSREQLLADCRFYSVDVEPLAGLPRRYMSDEKAEVIAFPKLKPSSNASIGEGTGRVIPFERK